ncbi:MAG TPA: tetratricopeptide repeat protein, partial [Gammaproteobacteria bacterium]|nr:tetratricopeptide repeat protein [Gammaproteobacteria bacterium]
MAMNRSVLRTRRKKAIDCARQGRFEEARKLLSAVCRAEPRDAEALCLLGAVSGQLGDYERALDCCRKATLL